jgi:AraC-like DNA-binding protein
LLDRASASSPMSTAARLVSIIGGMQRSATARRTSGTDAVSRAPVIANHAFFQPRPPLDQLVDFIWTAKSSPAPSPRERVLPTGAVALVINLGAERFEMYEHDHAPEPRRLPGAIVCGGRARPLVIATSLLGSTMGVHFKPGSARAFFGVPMGALEEHVESLEAMWGASGSTLRARLLETPTDAERVAVLEEALLERARGPLAVAPVLRAALAAFEDETLPSVANVRDRFNLSAKRMLQLFHDEVGLNPKAYWRVRRFRAALAQLDRRGMNGAALAAALGYADQPHFIREFRAISGGSPRQYLSGRVGDNSDHVSVFG